MAIVEAHDSEGNVAIGIEVEGVFIPVAGVPAERIAHAVERGKTLAERAEGPPGDAKDQAEQVLAAGFVVEGKKAAKKDAE